MKFTGALITCDQVLIEIIELGDVKEIKNVHCSPLEGGYQTCERQFGDFLKRGFQGSFTFITNVFIILSIIPTYKLLSMSYYALSLFLIYITQYSLFKPPTSLVAYFCKVPKVFFCIKSEYPSLNRPLPTFSVVVKNT